MQWECVMMSGVGLLHHLEVGEEVEEVAEQHRVHLGLTLHAVLVRVEAIVHGLVRGLVRGERGTLAGGIIRKQRFRSEPVALAAAVAALVTLSATATTLALALRRLLLAVATLGARPRRLVRIVIVHELCARRGQQAEVSC
jgi:hypothetical protein